MEARRAGESTENERLRASMRRLVLRADADRRAIERDLHGGVQQHLVALAVEVQLAAQAAKADPAAVGHLLDELARGVQHAVDETARLAERIFPATLDAGGLAVLLRSAGSKAGAGASVHVDAGSDVPSEVAMTLYLCWLDALGRSGGERRATIRIRESGDALDFDVLVDDAHATSTSDWLQDRVEALGGQLATAHCPDGGVSVAGSLPLRR